MAIASTADTERAEAERQINKLKQEEEETQLGREAAERNQLQAQAKADALIVAALMGHTIVNLNKLKGKKYQGQMSVPAAKPLFTLDSTQPTSPGNLSAKEHAKKSTSETNLSSKNTLNVISATGDERNIGTASASKASKTIKCKI